MNKLEETLKGKTPTLVAFIHEGKEDETEIKNITVELRKKYAGKANIVDFANPFNNRISQGFRITSYPCFILFKEGQELMRESGNKTVNQLSELIERAL